MKAYQMKLNYDDLVLEINQSEYDAIFENSADSKNKGMWIQNKYISFASIATIVETFKPEYNSNQLPEPEPLVVTPEIYDRRMRKVLAGIKAEVGENDFYKEMEKKLQNHQKTNTGLDLNMGLVGVDNSY